MLRTCDCGTWDCETTGCETFDCHEAGMDFGDAPLPTYHTRLGDDGARHEIDGVHYMGLRIDGEGDGQPNPTATGDDLPDERDDEDGVWFTTSLVRGRTAYLMVEASAEEYLNAWVDANSDGDWDDAGERIFERRPLDRGFNLLDYDVPRNALEDTTFSRFRFSTLGSLSPAGPAPNGEVENYRVPITSRFAAAIETDRLAYAQGEDAIIGFYLNEPAHVRLVEDREDGGLACCSKRRSPPARILNGCPSPSARAEGWWCWSRGPYPAARQWSARRSR